MNRRGELTVVLGIDGSGKSNLLRDFEQKLGYSVLEPSADSAARQFKTDHLQTPLHDALIDERELLYAGLNKVFDKQIGRRLQRGNVATSGSTLVTAMSHAVMRSVIGGPDYDTDAIVEQWSTTPGPKPDNIVLVHAPMEVIQARIAKRQQQGDQTEVFWSYNAPFYLNQMQQGLGALANSLETIVGYDVERIDTSIIPKGAAIEMYSRRHSQAA